MEYTKREMFIINQYWLGDKMQDYHISRRFFAMLHFGRTLKHLNRIERQVRLLSFLLGAIEESLS